MMKRTTGNKGNTGRGSHLSSEQMEAMLRESPYRKQAGKHLESCEACHDEVESLVKVLGGFRAASEAYAERTQAVVQPVRGAGGKRAGWSVVWGWSLAAGALACGLVTAPVVHRMATHSAASTVVGDPGPARTVEISDEALLEGVQDDLASSLPAPLQLLAAAGSNDSGRSAGETSGSRAAKH